MCCLVERRSCSSVRPNPNTVSAPLSALIAQLLAGNAIGLHRQSSRNGLKGHDKTCSRPLSWSERVHSSYLFVLHCRCSQYERWWWIVWTDWPQFQKQCVTHGDSEQSNGHMAAETTTLTAKELHHKLLNVKPKNSSFLTCRKNMAKRHLNCHKVNLKV